MSTTTQPEEAEAAEHGPSVASTAARGTALLLFAHAGSLALGYLVVIVLARELGPPVYGVYGAVISVLLATELMARLGVPQAVARLIAEDRAHARAIEQAGVTLTWLSSGAVFLLFFAAAPALARLLQIEDGARLLRLASLDIPFYCTFFLCQHVVNGHRDFRRESLGIFSYGLAKALGVLSLYLFGMTLEGALVVNIAASVAALVPLAFHLRARLFIPGRAALRRVLEVALPTALFVISSQLLFNVDLWCLTAATADSSDPQVGYYVAASNIGKLCSTPYFVMMSVLIPSVARAAAQGDAGLQQRLVRASMRLLLHLLLPACLLVALEAEGLMVLAYEADYEQGGGLLRLLVFRFGLFYTFLMTLCAVLLARGAPGAAARLVSLGTLAAIPVHLFCVAHYGAEGAAVSAVAVTAAVTLVAFALIWRSVGPIVELSCVLRIALSCVPACLLSYWIPAHGVWLVLELAAAMAVYGLTAWGIGEIRAQDFALLRRGKP